MLNFLFDGCVWLIRKIIRLPLLRKDMLYLPLSRKQIILMFIRKRLQKHTHCITIRILDIRLQLCQIDTLKLKRRYIRCHNCRIQLQDIRLYSINCRYHQVLCHQLHEQLIQEPSKSCFKIFFVPVANIVNNNRVFPVLVRI